MVYDKRHILVFIGSTHRYSTISLIEELRYKDYYRNSNLYRTHLKQGIKRYIEKAIYNKYISKLNYISENNFYIQQIHMEQVRLVKFSEI